MLPRLRLVSTIVALAGIYFIAGHLGLKLAFVHKSATAVWLPTGISLAALLIFGLRAWPGVFVGAFLVNATTAGNLATSICIAGGNTLEAVIGAELVTRFANGRDFFRQTRAFLRFVVLAALGSTMISATIGVGSLALFGFAPFAGLGSIWIHWWFGDATGALLIAPMMLAWHADPRLRWTRSQAIEGSMLLVALLAFGLIVFGGLVPEASQFPIAFLVMPLLLWPACCVGKRETATATFVLFLMALFGTLQGFGPFANETPFATLLSLQVFMGVVAVTSMVIAAATAERRRSTAELIFYQRELEAANARLNEQCLSDALTGVANRRAFEKRMAAEVARVRRRPAPLSLLIVDVDRFRHHNQILGHAGADEVLRTIASVLKGQIRATDHLARYGGDEFVILLPETDLKGARTIAERCRRSVASTSWERRSVTVSIGAAAFEAVSGQSADLLADADDALFRAKGAGRNRVFQGTRPRRRTGTAQTEAASAVSAC